MGYLRAYGGIPESLANTSIIMLVQSPVVEGGHL